MRRVLPILFVLLYALTACVTLPPPAAPPASEAAEAEPVPSTAAEPAPATPTDLTERLPLDPTIRTGRLANGLTYYIRHNAEPAQRAELWLAVNAGSVMEEDDQKGLAHFLEHMMFKGTERFPSQALFDFLEGIGMRFGPEINAYTSFDETVYTLQVPTEDEADLSKALDVLQDWAGAATLAPEDFDNERGVIVEEWRLRDKTAAGRMQDKIVPMLLGNSQYAQRLPIGDMEIVRNAPIDTLRRFYETWYRPDLMAVIAVGDFEVDKVETLIRERFSQLQAGAASTPRPGFDVPAHAGTSALVVKDPENPYTVVSVYQSLPSRKLETVGDYRSLLLDYLVSIMLNQRYAEVAQHADAPFLQAEAGTDNLVRSTDVYGLYAVVQEAGALAGLDALMTEFERARRHGFTASEFERATQDLLSFYESADKERETRDSSGYANEYVDLYLKNIASPGIAYEYPMVQGLLPGITLDDVNQRIAGLVTTDNRAIILQAPEKADLQLPGEAELTAAVDAVDGKDLKPYVDRVAQTELMDERLTPVAVLSEKTLPDLGVTDITLANGVRVIMKPTTFKQDEVVFSAISPGGNSLVTDEDFAEASVASVWVDMSGVGNLDNIELRKLLVGKNVSVVPLIDELEEGFIGGASPDDLETAFQLLYLYATQPRSDEETFQVLQNQLETGLQNRSLEPESALEDALTEILCGTGVRCVPMSLEEVDELDAQRTIEIYRDRFADFSDFTFTFVGNFELDTLKTLAQTYLGNLPSTGREETWRDVQADPPAAVVERMVYRGLEERSRTRIHFTGPVSPTLENQVLLDVLENVLDLRVIAELRQELGASYSPQAASGWTRLPEPTYDALIDFVSDPARVEELAQAVFALLEDIRTRGPAESDVQKAKEQVRLARQRALGENGFWLAQLEDHLTTPGDDGSDILRYEEVLAEVTVADVQQAAQQFLPADRYVKVVLYPEGFEETGDN